MAVVHLQDVVDFAIVNGNVFRIAFVFHVGGTDDGKLVHPRNDKHNAVVFVLQNISLLLIVYARHHDMAAFDKTNAIR